MSKNFRVPHFKSGFLMKYREVVAGIGNCALTWVEPGASWRYLTPQEAAEARNAQAAARELQEQVLGRGEVGGCKFVPPATTSYQPPWDAIRENTAPIMVLKCRWPRMGHAL